MKIMENRVAMLKKKRVLKEKKLRNEEGGAFTDPPVSKSTTEDAFRGVSSEVDVTASDSSKAFAIVISTTALLLLAAAAAYALRYCRNKKKSRKRVEIVPETIPFLSKYEEGENAWEGGRPVHSKERHFKGRERKRIPYRLILLRNEYESAGNDESKGGDHFLSPSYSAHSTGCCVGERESDLYEDAANASERASRSQPLLYSDVGRKFGKFDASPHEVLDNNKDSDCPSAVSTSSDGGEFHSCNSSDGDIRSFDESEPSVDDFSAIELEGPPSSSDAYSSANPSVFIPNKFHTPIRFIRDSETSTDLGASNRNGNGFNYSTPKNIAFIRRPSPRRSPAQSQRRKWAEDIAPEMGGRKESAEVSATSSSPISGEVSVLESRGTSGNKRDTKSLVAKHRPPDRVGRSEPPISEKCTRNEKESLSSSCTKEKNSLTPLKIEIMSDKPQKHLEDMPSARTRSPEATESGRRSYGQCRHLLSEADRSLSSSEASSGTPSVTPGDWIGDVEFPRGGTFSVLSLGTPKPFRKPRSYSWGHEKG